MLKGDLASTPLPEVLRQLADGGATGCLHVVDPADAAGEVYLRGGLVYAVVLPGTRVTLGPRLVSSGALTPEALAEAVEAQERQAWRLGELLVHLGHVDQPVVDALVAEQVREDLSDLLLWHDGTWRFRVNQRTREDVAPPVEVRQLLGEVQQRPPASDELTRFGPDAVPVLSAAGSTDAELVVDGDAWSLLCTVDGTRTIAELARDGGLTLTAARSLLHALVQAGLLEVEVPAPDDGEDADVVLQPSVSADVAARLASALAPAASLRAQVDDVPRHDPPRRLDRQDDAEVEHSISRVSAALSAMLGQSALSDDLFAAPSSRRAAVPVVEPRDTSRGDRDAGEPAAAQWTGTRRPSRPRVRQSPGAQPGAAPLTQRGAELEASRAADTQPRARDLGAEHVADVVDLAALREEDSRLAEEARRAEAARAAEAARLVEEAAAEEARLAALRAEQAPAEQAHQAEQAQAKQAPAEQARLADEARAVAEAEVSRLATELDEPIDPAPVVGTALDASEHRSEPGVDDDMARASAQLQADVFAELSAAATHVPPAVIVAEPAAEPAAEPEAEPGVVVVDEAPARYHEGTDTAALLRELSSLGLDDPAPPPSTRPVGSTPRPSAGPPKKRKGLFGR